MRITFEMVERCYENADSVFKEKISMETALNNLCNAELQMNKKSALFYINAYVSMRNGELYKKTINEVATEYYLGRIYLDYGKAELKKALDAVKSHIDYYAKSSSRNKLKSIEYAYKLFSMFLK